MRKLSRREVLAGLYLPLLWRLPRAVAATGPVPIIDTHMHYPRAPGGELGGFDPAAAVREMDRFGIARAILSPPPLPRSTRRVHLSDLRAALRREPRLAFAAGGESLNPMLQVTPAAGVPARVLHEFTAKAEEIAVERASFPWLASGRSLSIGRDEGFTKLLFDPHTRRLLGAGIVGTNAGELIAEATLAIEMGADAADIGLTVHAHPTLAETVAFAADAYEGTLTELYLPKRAR
jgi:hypothetical protein